jgi:hypothetical protein
MLLFPHISQAQTPPPLAIDNFIIKESLLKNEKITVIATDDQEIPLENVRGTFLFTINGFKEELNFSGGTATAAGQIDKSTFVYLKHRNEAGTHAKLYYVLKQGINLHPIKISWIILLAVPLILIVLSVMFRKFIIISVILLAIIFFFNYSKGLDISTFFDTVYNGIRSIF